MAGPLLGLRLIGGLVTGVGVLALTRWPVAALAVAALVIFWPALFGAVGARGTGWRSWRRWPCGPSR